MKIACILSVIASLIPAAVAFNVIDGDELDSVSNEKNPIKVRTLPGYGFKKGAAGSRGGSKGRSMSGMMGSMGSMGGMMGSKGGMMMASYPTHAPIPAPEPTILEFAVEKKFLSTLETAVVATKDNSDLFSVLGGGDRVFTLLAPTNKAFKKLLAANPRFVTALLTDPAWVGHLITILFAHLISDAVVESSDLEDGMTVPVRASQIGTPPSITVTASVGEEICFSSAGSGPACVIKGDFEASNGIVHVIDDVLLPDFALLSIVQLAGLNPLFSTLATLLTCSGIINELEGIFGYTIFAPPNPAFDALFAQTGLDIETLCGQQVELLREVLTYHVLPFVLAVPTEDTMVDLTTLQGGDVSIVFEASDDGGCPDAFTINGYNWAGQAFANNGIVHIIEGVLLPE